MNDDRLRLPLPRGGLNVAAAHDAAGRESTVVVTPDYDDKRLGAAPAPKNAAPSPLQRRPAREDRGARNLFEAYGERTESRPFSLRVPEPIDLVLRQIAAERHTQPLRIVDQVIRDYLVKLGRLPRAPEVDEADRRFSQRGRHA
jgi:hypothetical protein